MKPILGIAAVALAFGALGTAVAQQTHTVELIIQETEGEPIPQFYFQPTGLLIQPGDTVEFVARSPHHTVTAYHPQQGKAQRVPDGVEPFSSPVIVLDGSWSYTFETPGTYDIWCAPHEMYGMAMRIVVGEPGGPAETPSEDFGPEGTFGTAGTVLNDEALSSENIVEKGGVSWEELSDESKRYEAPAGASDGAEADQP